MERKLYDNYLAILKSELMVALGCTEPIAIAYAAARARETPVSYTHLDVYKRQTGGRVEKRNAGQPEQSVQSGMARRTADTESSDLL